MKNKQKNPSFIGWNFFTHIYYNANTRKNYLNINLYLFYYNEVYKRNRK